ncbi:MAG: TatD family deoxyribonuclease [Rhodocyclaceae bacterium]|nr:MAG: TatD family deoxyribonuclease [Rhodocyclaceae bacterium]
MLVDSHCHLDFPDYSGKIDQVIDSMEKNRVMYALCAGVSLEGFPTLLALVEDHPQFFAAVGVHPDTQGGADPDVSTLVELARHPKVVAIGETGLDYYRIEGDLEWQRNRFRNHIRAAREIGKPLIIHTRSAAQDTLRLMREEGADKVAGVMHCFTESMETAEAAMSMGFYISFSGIVSFKNARELKEVATRIPLDRMLVETDSPYLAPSPHRGKTNQPAYVMHVAEEIARLRGISLAEVAEITTRNFFRLFRSASGALMP